MADPGDSHPTGSTHRDGTGHTPPPTFRRRRTSSGPGPGVAVGLILLLAAIGTGWYLLQSGDDDTPSLAESSEPTPADAAPTGFPPVPPLDLPELSASDAFVRGLVQRLSAHPQLAAWLATEGLVDRFVRVVIDLAGGSTPAANLRYMAPTEPFRVRTEGGRSVIDPASYGRFDLMAAVFASLDTPGTVQLYRQLLPLIEKSYAELGIPEFTFDETLGFAIRNVLAVEVPEGPIEVRAVEGFYLFADPALEANRGAAKQLIRMGPVNARLIQGKMTEFAHALGIHP